MSRPRVSVIVLNWNGAEDTSECLESLRKTAYPDCEVVVVDNASDGDDVRALKQRFGDFIQTIENERNLGVGEGFNAGIRHVLKTSSPEYVVIMNNDLVLDPDCLSELVRAAETDERIGIVGPKIYFSDRHGRKDVIWSAGGRVRWWGIKVHSQIGEGEDDSPKYQNERDVDWISGCVLMFRSSLAERIGLLNPWYFIGHEDVEYCLKARRHGFRVVYVPSAVAWHEVGVSRMKAHVSLADPSAYYYLVRNNFPLPVYVYQLLLMPALLSRWALLYLLKYRDAGMLRRFLRDLAGLPLGRRRRTL
jgi:GT2 family glycosyltransferase